MLIGQYTDEQIEEWAAMGWNVYHAKTGPRWADLKPMLKARQLPIARDIAIHGGASTPLEAAYRDAFIKWQSGQSEPTSPPPLATIVEEPINRPTDKPKKKR
jgi:hypothetical protein